VTPTRYVFSNLIPGMPPLSAEELQRRLAKADESSRSRIARLLCEHWSGDHPDWLRAMAEAPSPEERERDRARVVGEMKRERVVKIAQRALRDGLVDEDEAFELSRQFADDPQGLREQLGWPQSAESDAAVRAEIARTFELDLDHVPPARPEWAQEEERLLAEQPTPDLQEREEIARTFGMRVEEVV
jgi:hypothetical protein